MFLIEKDVPLPRPASGRGNKGEFRKSLERMAVGDSFLVEDWPRTKVSGYAAHVTKACGWRFATREVEGGIRVWRTA